MIKITSYKRTGLIGIFGFFGLRYFENYDPKYLLLLSYFSFFAHFLLHNVMKEKQDERMLLNYDKAKNLSMQAAYLILVFIGFAAFVSPSESIPLILVSFGVVAINLTYVVSFLLFEQYS